MKLLLPFFFIFITGCNSRSDKSPEQQKQIVSEKHVVNLPKVDNSRSDVNALEKVEGAIGILTTSDTYKFGDTIRVYKPNGKLLTVLKNSEEYQIIALKCLAQTPLHYRVLLENGKQGLVSRNSKHIKFQTWEEHILTLFSVKFNELNNPLRDKPSSEGKELYFDKDEFYHPARIDGEWLKVEWDSDDKKEYGWVRWKIKGKLLIEFYYFA